MKKSLLEIAKEIKLGRNTKLKTDEELEVIFAWLKDEISLRQLSFVQENQTGNYLYCFIATGLRQAYQEGKISIK